METGYLSISRKVRNEHRLFGTTFSYLQYLAKLQKLQNKAIRIITVPL